MKTSADYVEVKQERNNTKPEIWADVVIYSIFSHVLEKKKTFIK